MLIFGSGTEERLVAMTEQNNGINKSLILIGAIILIILAGGASYFYTMSQTSSVSTNSTMTTNAPANLTMTPGAATSLENMTVSTSANVTTLNTSTNATTNFSVIQQNATMQNYHVTLRLGPPAQMLPMNQTATATTGDVIVSGQMSNSASVNMTGTYHLEVHVYNLTNGAVVTNQNVTIQIIDNTTNQTLTVPVIVMYDLKIGPSDTNFGNNIMFAPGSYTIIVNVAGETAKFNINVTYP